MVPLTTRMVVSRLRSNISAFALMLLTSASVHAAEIASVPVEDGGAKAPTTTSPVKKTTATYMKELPKPAQELFYGGTAPVRAHQRFMKHQRGGAVVAESPVRTQALPDSPSSELGLTLEDVVRRALDNSPEREIASEQVMQAAAAVDEARANYWPQMNFKGEHGREYNDPYALRQGATTHDGYNYGFSTSVNARQMIYDGFITNQTVQQRLQLVESANLSREKVSEELIKFSVEVYMELYQFQQIKKAAEENLTALQNIAQLIALRVEAGDASKVEQNYMKARLASAKQQYINAQSSLQDSFSALSYLIGEVPEFKAQIPDLEQYRIQEPRTLIARALENNTQMRLVESDIEAAEHELSAAKGRYSPTVDMVVDGAHSEGLGGDTGVHRTGSAKLQLNIKLLDGGLRKATAKRQYAKLREIEARRSRVEREVTQNVKQSYNKLRTNLQELQIAQDEIEANTELETLYRRQFQEGEVDITLLVESQERIFAASTRKARLESDTVKIVFELLSATAEMLPKFCSDRGC